MIFDISSAKNESSSILIVVLFILEYNRFRLLHDFRMNHTGSILRRRLPYYRSPYLVCWALPLLCLSTTTRSIHHLLLGKSLLDCQAFTVSPITGSRSNQSRFETRWPSKVRSNSNLLKSSSLTENDENDWSSLRVVELKQELKERGLKVSGLKADMVKRLKDSDAAPTRPKRKAASSSKKKTASSPKKKKVAASPKKKPASPKAGDHQRITEIDDLPKLWNDDMAKANGSYSKLDCRFIFEFCLMDSFVSGFIANRHLYFIFH